MDMALTARMMDAPRPSAPASSRAWCRPTGLLDEALGAAEVINAMSGRA